MKNILNDKLRRLLFTFLVSGVILWLMLSSFTSLGLGQQPSFDLPSEIELFQSLKPKRFPSIEGKYRDTIYDLPLSPIAKDPEVIRFWKDYGLASANDLKIDIIYSNYPYAAWTGNYRTSNTQVGDTFNNAMQGYLALTSWKGGDIDTLLFETTHSQYKDIQFTTIRNLDRIPGKADISKLNLILNAFVKSQQLPDGVGAGGVLLGSIAGQIDDDRDFINYACYVATVPYQYRSGIYYEYAITYVYRTIRCLQLFDGIAMNLDRDPEYEIIAVGMAFDDRSGNTYGLVLIIDLPALNDVRVLRWSVLQNEYLFVKCRPGRGGATTYWFVTLNYIGADPRGDFLHFITTGECLTANPRDLPELQIVARPFSICVTASGCRIPPDIVSYINPESVAVHRIDTQGNITSELYNSFTTDSTVKDGVVYLSTTAIDPSANSGGALVKTYIDQKLDPPARQAVIAVRQLQYIHKLTFWSIAQYPHVTGDKFLLAGSWYNNTNVIFAMELDGTNPRNRNYPVYPRNSIIQSNTIPMGIYEVEVYDIDLDGELEIIATGLLQRNDIMDKDGGGAAIIPFIMILGKTTITTTTTSTIPVTTTETTTETTTSLVKTTQTRHQVEFLTTTTTKRHTLIIPSTQLHVVTSVETLTRETTERRLEIMTITSTQTLRKAGAARTTVYQFINTTTTYTTTVAAGDAGSFFLNPFNASNLPALLAALIPGLMLGLLIPFPIILRRRPLVRIVYSEPSMLHYKAKEIATNVIWMADVEKIKLNTSIEPTKEEGTITVYVKGKRIYHTRDGEEVDSVLIANIIIEKVLRKRRPTKR